MGGLVGRGENHQILPGSWLFTAAARCRGCDASTRQVKRALAEMSTLTTSAQVVPEGTGWPMGFPTIGLATISVELVVCRLAG